VTTKATSSVTRVVRRTVLVIESPESHKPETPFMLGIPD
jgi:hypothetical protein